MECLHLSARWLGRPSYVVSVKALCWFAVSFLAGLCRAAGMRLLEEALFLPLSSPLFTATFYSHHPLQLGSGPTLEESVGRAVIPLLSCVCSSWESQEEKGGNLGSPAWVIPGGAAGGRVAPCVRCGKLVFLWARGREWVELENPHKNSLCEICWLDNGVIGSIVQSLNHPWLLPGRRWGCSGDSFCSGTWLQAGYFPLIPVFDFYPKRTSVL